MACSSRADRGRHVGHRGATGELSGDAHRLPLCPLGAPIGFLGEGGIPVKRATQGDSVEKYVPLNSDGLCAPSVE